MSNLALNIDGRILHIHFTDNRVEWDDQSFEIEVLKRLEQGFLLRINGEIRPCYYSIEQDRIELWINGRFIRALRSRSASTESPLGQDEEIRASMPGRILKIEVHENDRVNKGEPLIVMESMKMELTLSASHDATVEKIPAQAGAMVEPGQLLLKLKS